MALSLFGVAASLVEIFTVCMPLLSLLLAAAVNCNLRRFSSEISTAAGLVVFSFSFVWGRLECSICVHVGHGVGDDLAKQKASLSRSSLP
jgi:hypothetical protein